MAQAGKRAVHPAQMNAANWIHRKSTFGRVCLLFKRDWNGRRAHRAIDSASPLGLARGRFGEPPLPTKAGHPERSEGPRIRTCDILSLMRVTRSPVERSLAVFAARDDSAT